MDIQTYLQVRVDEQIQWFAKQSKYNKYFYYTFKLILTASAVVLPALTSYVDIDGMKVLIGLFSIITAFLANINSLFNFKDKWLIYRSAAETLRSEKFSFEAGSGRYKEIADKNTLLVDTIEGYLHKVNAQWKDTVNLENDKGNGG
jgi:hypothetical protein